MNWIEIIEKFLNQGIEWLTLWGPRILLGLLFLLIGRIFAKVVSRVISRALSTIKFDVLMDRLEIGDYLRKVNISQKPSGIVGRIAYWSLMMIILVLVADQWGLSALSSKINALVAYIPNILVALFILVMGLYLANGIRNFLLSTLSAYGLTSGKVISNLLFYLLMIFVSLTSLEQLQFNIDLLTSNVMILLGGVALAFAIGYGLAAKEIFPNIISSYYSKSMYTIGQKIRVGEAEGEIIEITSLSVVIKTEEGKRIIPSKKLITEEVDIL
ncbi:MAG: mechanosensitive ion channel domain-containing protein [Bacteroidota bacterium]